MKFMGMKFEVNDAVPDDELWVVGPEMKWPRQQKILAKIVDLAHSPKNFRRKS